VGKRQHFVPRFYLGAFASAERRIHVFNLRRNQVIPDASLRDQCYAHRLYGGDDVLEKALAQMEGAAAPVFRAMRSRDALPGGGTPQHDVLTGFLGFQLGRTTAAQANALAATQLLAKVVFDGAPPKGHEMTADEAMIVTLTAAPKMAATIGDLSMTLVRAERGASFVTSDNPVCRYNSYCEGLKEFGVTGTTCRGLQLFLPVSSSLLLYLFDGATYKLLRPRGRLATATPDDVNALNRLQLVNARDNVYFDTAELGPWLVEAAPRIKSAREDNRPRVTEAVEDGNERSRLLHQFWPMPQLALGLSFATIRANAQRVPLFDRAHQLRAPYSVPPRRDETQGATRRFEVRSRY
jgi:hypothetical protein